MVEAWSHVDSEGVENGITFRGERKTLGLAFIKWSRKTSAVEHTEIYGTIYEEGFLRIKDSSAHQTTDQPRTPPSTPDMRHACAGGRDRYCTTLMTLTHVSVQRASPCPYRRTTLCTTISPFYRCVPAKPCTSLLPPHVTRFLPHSSSKP